jgi:hypothetical protein
VVTRGRKPKPAHLRLIDGSRSTSRHGTEAELRNTIEQSNAAFGALKRPKGLKGSALVAWKEWIEPAAWLDGSRGISARALCELYGEFLDRPTDFPASKHSQMRAYMAELGLSDERRRSGGLIDKPKSKFFNDEFFGD